MPAKPNEIAGRDAPFSSIPAAAYGLAACLAIIGSNAFSLGAIAPAIAKSLGVQGPDVMLAASAYGLGTAGSALLLSSHIDRLGVFRCLKRAMAALTVALCLSSVAPSVAMLTVAQLLAGVAVGVAVPAIYAGALAIAPHGKESRTVGVALGGWTFSLMAGVALSTFLTEFVGWRAVFAVNAAMSVATVLAMAPLTDRAVKPAVSSAPVTALGIPGIRRLLLACALAMAAFYGLYSYLGDHLYRGLGQALVVNGLATLLYGAGFGMATFLDSIVDRLGSKILLPAIFVMGGGIYAAIAVWSQSLPVVLILFLVLGLVNHLQVNLLVTRLTDSGPDRKGAILGLNTAVTYLGSLTGTAAFAVIYSACGFRSIAALSAVLMIAASLLATGRGQRSVP